MRLTEKPPAEETELEALIKKELDAVIGDRFKEKVSVRTWMWGALLAIAAVALITWVLHTHLVQAPATPASAKPVVIDIVPAR
jgi:hypothetical protein